MIGKALTYMMLLIGLLLNGCVAQEAISTFGFEKDSPQWTIPEKFEGQIIFNAKMAHTGKQSLEIEAAKKQNSPFAVKIIKSAVSSADYQFSVWARVAPGSPVAQGAIKYELYNATGKNTTGGYSVAGLSANGKWQKISIAFQTAEDTTSLRFYLRVFGASKVLFDDASVEMPVISVVGPQRTAIEIADPTSVTYRISLRDSWIKSDLPQVYAELGLASSTQKQIVKTQVKKLDKQHLEVTVPIPALSAGDYSIQFYYTKDGQKLRTDTGAFLFTKVPSRKPTFLSKTGTVLHNGKPFFPIGMYHPKVSEYKLLSENNFNAVQGNASQADLDIAQKYGLAIDAVLYGGMRVAENLENSLSKIRRFADHPALLCWKIIDEPDAHSVANEVPAVYRALKAADPNNPIELTFGPETLAPANTLNFWTNFSDIIQIDRYPVPGNPLTWVSDFTRKAASHKKPWQNLQYVLQSGWKKDLSNQPSVAQARSMVYLSLIEGAKGIWWYSMHESSGWDLTKTPLWPHMKDINAEIKVLSEPIMLGHTVKGIICNQESVYFRAFEYQDKTYLLVTNPGDKPLQTTFTLPDAYQSSCLLKDGVQKDIQNGELNITLQGIDSRTYILQK